MTTDDTVEKTHETGDANRTPVLWEVSDGVATLTLNRPEVHNAHDGPMERLLLELLARADDDPEVRVVIITGAGKAFCAGGDAMMAREIVAAGGWSGSIPVPMETFAQNIRKPVVAAINGACIGGGLVWALSCDVRFAARGARLSAMFPRRGCVAERGISWLLPRLVGLGHASDLLLSGRLVDADEALDMGLVNKVVAPEDLLAEARAWATDVTRNCSPSAMAVIKSQLRADADRSQASALAASAEQVMVATTGDGDFKEGFLSFLERREARFAPLEPSPARGGTFVPPPA